MTTKQEYLIEKIELDITSMGKQGELIGVGKTETPSGMKRTERLQVLKERVLKMLKELEETFK